MGLIFPCGCVAVSVNGQGHIHKCEDHWGMTSEEYSRAMKKLDATEAQRNRQNAREANGKYRKMPEYCCEDCGKFVGLDYWSDPNCNDTGEGMVLCKKCCEKRVERGENAQ